MVVFKTSHAFFMKIGFLKSYKTI